MSHKCLRSLCGGNLWGGCVWRGDILHAPGIIILQSIIYHDSNFREIVTRRERKIMGSNGLFGYPSLLISILPDQSGRSNSIQKTNI